MPHRREDTRPTVRTGAPPPLEGLSREADQGRGEGWVRASPGPPPPPDLDPLRGSSPQGEGEYSSSHATDPDAYGGMPSIPSYRRRPVFTTLPHTSGEVVDTGPRPSPVQARMTGWTQIVLQMTQLLRNGP